MPIKCFNNVFDLGLNEFLQACDEIQLVLAQIEKLHSMKYLDLVDAHLFQKRLVGHHCTESSHPWPGASVNDYTKQFLNLINAIYDVAGSNLNARTCCWLAELSSGFLHLASAADWTGLGKVSDADAGVVSSKSFDLWCLML